MRNNHLRTKRRKLYLILRIIEIPQPQLLLRRYNLRQFNSHSLVYKPQEEILTQNLNQTYHNQNHQFLLRSQSTWFSNKMILELKNLQRIC